MSPPNDSPGLIRDGFTSETCGNCRFGVMIDAANIMVRECRGVPPTPVLVAIQQVGNKRGMEVELFSPRVSADRPACSLWKTKAALLAANQ